VHTVPLDHASKSMIEGSTLLGVLAFHDPPKRTAKDAIHTLTADAGLRYARMYVCM
jgi:magnesium-transporting ATPase (P-type)